MRKIVPFLIFIILTPQIASKPVDIKEFRCDGGWCLDGEDHILDCSESFCTGDSDPSQFPTLLPSYGNGSWLSKESMVLGLEIANKSFAYPLKIMNLYETVSDTIENIPVLISYCPLCGSGIVYDRRLDGKILTLYNSGEIWQRDLVLYDLGTESRWSQIAAKALTGEMYGKRLKILNSVLMQWDHWRKIHPLTQVLNRPVDKQGNILYNFSNDYYDSSRLVHGVVIENQPIAFPLDILANEEILNLNIEGKDIIVLFAGGDGYVYRSDGSEFYFSNSTVISNGSSFYNVYTGKQIGGYSPLKLISGMTMYEFAWENFYPNSLIYSDEGFVTLKEDRDNQLISIFTIVFLISFVIIVLILRRIYFKIELMD